MEECRTVAKYILLSSMIALVHCATETTSTPPPNLLNIVDDIIPDVENSTQKVIRVNTVDLPAIIEDDKNSTDSSLYNIQSLLPPPVYLSSKKFRKPQVTQTVGDSPIIRSLPELKLSKTKKPKQKHLHLLYNQQDYDGKQIGKRMKVRVAPGAYPIYYILAKTNGQFRKQPIKGFRNEQELEKYFEKVKKVDKFNTISR
ncbi:uncharacterized protein LOC129914126 [Episyrphus balteatus]|uniref:uncharacterized protein LOC129914126 n=1 Tax=Episyrphus balteatus TaxID=286459 RepID=UPI0024865C2D|nr:uncharacterized protein LOC129914126 [Episyrphus balteatus]